MLPVTFYLLCDLILSIIGHTGFCKYYESMLHSYVPMVLIFLCDQDRGEGVLKFMMDAPIFSGLGFFSLIFWAGQGVTSIRIA